jgi:hypothetical protein
VEQVPIRQHEAAEVDDRGEKEKAERRREPPATVRADRRVHVMMRLGCGGRAWMVMKYR